MPTETTTIRVSRRTRDAALRSEREAARTDALGGADELIAGVEHELYVVVPVSSSRAPSPRSLVSTVRPERVGGGHGGDRDHGHHDKSR
ncbi:MAG: hypothetical protein M0T77_13310 [Actinomycetota bacterium]|nr:hypothetical protein [Actinomycetota bacterium]